MMKFKSLFRRKASPTGNDPHSGVTSPSASSISHSSSSSSLATHSANSPVHSASGQVGGGLSSGEVSAGSPITITSRIRNSSTEPNLLVPRPVPGPQQADYQLYTDEASGGSEYLDATNHTLNETLAMRDIPDHMAGAHAVCWDGQLSKQSNSGSEVSLACLQGRIQAMEETHYSTHEELQATLQELADLQVQLNEFQAENDKLKEEKMTLKRKLEIRTEQFKQARDQMDSLKQHLLLQCNEAEDERKSLQAKLMEVNKLLATQQGEASQREQHVTWLMARIRHLETCINEGDTKLHSELSKLVKENEKLKEDKESTEGTVVTAQDQLAAALRENTSLRDQLTVAQEELRSVRQKSKEEVADLEYKVEQLLAKKQSLIVETTNLSSSVAELESACRRHLEDKREMRSAAADQQLRLADALARRDEVERILGEERARWDGQQEEWQQFQKDLLTTVRVANDFKLETLASMEKVLEENRSLREKLGAPPSSPSSPAAAAVSAGTSDRAGSSVRPRLLLRSLSTLDSSSTSGLVSSSIGDIKPRAVATRVDKGSVKRIIENLEVGSASRPGSNNGNNKLADTPSPTVEPVTVSSPPVATVRPRSEPVVRPTSGGLHRTESETVFLRTSPSTNVRPGPNEPRLSDPIFNKATPIRSVRHLDLLSSTSESNTLSQVSDRKDPLAGLVKNGGSKRNALLKWCQTRTASYPDIEITNFSSSWNDGLALCALLHTYLPDQIPFHSLDAVDVRRNFQMAFRAAESVGITTSLDLEELASTDRPDWQSVMTYITAVYKHFEIC